MELDPIFNVLRKLAAAGGQFLMKWLFFIRLKSKLALFVLRLLIICKVKMNICNIFQHSKMWISLKRVQTTYFETNIGECTHKIFNEFLSHLLGAEWKQCKTSLMLIKNFKRSHYLYFISSFSLIRWKIKLISTLK
jgi:hypothetical protein